MAKEIYVPGSGELFKISRNLIEKHAKCPRCFYLYCRDGLREPSSPMSRVPFTFDELMKTQFDRARVAGTVPDVLQRAAIPLTPFGHPDIETWRNNRKGVTAKLNDLGLEVSGAIDDVLADANGRLYMCDFKSTTGNSPIETFGDKEHHESYQRQLEVYQWIFEQNGFETADTGYLIFGAAGVVETNGKLSIVFHESVISVQLDNGWVGAEVQKIKNTLDSNSAPSPNEKCGYCKYSQERSDLEKRG